jgi:mRNA-degrading endonuclease RelE of RelBE toxin-antitoxin system
MSYEIVLTGAFKDAIRKLKKRYRHILDDVEAAVAVLQENPKLGDVIPNGHGARKVRISNRDSQRGKSGGYRVIYYLVVSPGQLYLLAIYSKSDKEDVSTKEIEELLKQAGLW